MHPKRFRARERLAAASLGALGALGALALAPAIALGAPAGGSAQVATAAPDLASAQVLVNPPPTSGGSAQLTLCFDKAIDPASVGGLVAKTKVLGYGGNELPLAGATAAIDAGNGKCAALTVPPVAGSAVDLKGFTVASVGQGGARDAGGRPSVPGAVGVHAPDAPEITPQLGETTGPAFTGASKVAASGQIVYSFNRTLDPTFKPPPQSFSYVAHDGSTVKGTGAVVEGTTVTVTFPPALITTDVRYAVEAGAVRTATQGVPNPAGARGAASTSPSLLSGSPTPGVPGSFDLRYGQPVVAPITPPARFTGYLEDNTAVTLTGAPSQPDFFTVRVAIDPTLVLAAGKLTRVVDPGGAVTALIGGSPSDVGEADLTTPNMVEGFTDGPDLTGVTVNANSGTATFTFDGTPLALGSANAAQFQLVNADGTLSSGASTASVSANTVVARFGSAAFATAVGGTVGPLAVTDNQGKGNVAGATSGATPPPGPTTGTSGTTPAAPTAKPLPPRRISLAGITAKASQHRGRTLTIFRVSGKIVLPSWVPRPLYATVCPGPVAIAIRHRRRTLSHATVNVRSNCTFGETVKIANRRLRGRGANSITYRFAGNRFFKPTSTRAGRVTGR